MDARCGAVRVLMSRRVRSNVPQVSRTALHASPSRALKVPLCQRLSDNTKPASSLSRSSEPNATLLEFCRRQFPGTIIGLVYCPTPTTKAIRWCPSVSTGLPIAHACPLASTVSGAAVPPLEPARVSPRTAAKPMNTRRNGEPCSGIAITPF